MFSKLVRCRSLLLARRVCTSAQMKQQPSLVKLKKNQARYQCEDGKPIWLKNGITDKLLYLTTVVCCYLGVGMTLHMVYELAKPASWREPKAED